jgi:hypothetical protein
MGSMRPKIVSVICFSACVLRSSTAPTLAMESGNYEGVPKPLAVANVRSAWRRTVARVGSLLSKA